MKSFPTKNLWGKLSCLLFALFFLSACGSPTAPLAESPPTTPSPGQVSPPQTNPAPATSPSLPAQYPSGPPAQIEITFDERDVVHIGDRFFATYVNDILLNNFEHYLGRPIRYEGLFWSVYWEFTSRYYHYVIRHTYGCCGPYDTSVGFELALGEFSPPPEGTWVEVTGILERSGGDGISHIRLRVLSLVPLEEAGQLFVPN